MEHSRSPSDPVSALRNLFNSPNGAANKDKQIFHIYSIVRIDVAICVFAERVGSTKRTCMFSIFFPCICSPVFVIAFALYSELQLLGSKVLNGVSVVCILFGICYL